MFSSGLKYGTHIDGCILIFKAKFRPARFERAFLTAGHATFANDEASNASTVGKSVVGRVCHDGLKNLAVVSEVADTKRHSVVRNYAY